MVKRRTRIDWNELNDQILTEGGNDFDYCVNQFIKNLKLRNLSEHTIGFYDKNLTVIRRSMKALGINENPESITRSQLEDVLCYCMDELNNSPGTINHRISTLKQFFKFLQQANYIESDPAEKLKKQKTKQVQVQPFTELEIKALLNAPDKRTFVGYRDYVTMMLLLETGIRLSEITNLKIHDINLEHNEILITNGKGNKERKVYFQYLMKEHLKKYLKVRGTLEHDYLLIGRSNSPLRNKALQDRITIYGELAQINKRVSPHTFRHTFAKLYITNGGDAFSLQQILGHTTSEMTKKYVQLFGADLRQLHKKYSPIEGMVNRL